MKSDAQFLASTLEPELDEISEKWSREKRLATAAKLEKWAKLLKLSIGFIDGTLPGDFVPQVAPPITVPAPPPQKAKKQNRRPGRGWIAVNFSKQDTLELKKLARADGMNFRSICEFALRNAARDLRENLGLSCIQASKLTPKQIAALAERSWLGRRLVQTLVPEKN